MKIPVVDKIVELLMRNIFFKNFLKIELTSMEEDIAEDNILEKYVPCFRNFLFAAILILPALIFSPVSILSLVAMVLVGLIAGSISAWFGITLATVKKKFELFGLELTVNLFNALLVSLAIMADLIFVSFNQLLLEPIIVWGQNHPLAVIFSGLLGTVVAISSIVNMKIGSFKYDMNDAMLTGQNEAAEMFFKKGLSKLYEAANILKQGKSLQVANYYIGVCFQEVLGYILDIGVENDMINTCLNKAQVLSNKPYMEQKKADDITLLLIQKFLEFCVATDGQIGRYRMIIEDELKCILENEEDQHVVDSRFARIFETIANMIEVSGESLFLAKR